MEVERPRDGYIKVVYEDFVSSSISHSCSELKIPRIGGFLESYGRYGWVSDGCQSVIISMDVPSLGRVCVEEVHLVSSFDVESR